LTILYRHPQRPDEAGMTVVADQTKATAMKAQLEHRGYLVIRIEPATFAKAMPAASFAKEALLSQDDADRRISFAL
jgi:hypothetical protein